MKKIVFILLIVESIIWTTAWKMGVNYGNKLELAIITVVSLMPVFAGLGCLLFAKRENKVRKVFIFTFIMSYISIAIALVLLSGVVDLGGKNA